MEDSGGPEPCSLPTLPAPRRGAGGEAWSRPALPALRPPSPDWKHWRWGGAENCGGSSLPTPVHPVCAQGPTGGPVGTGTSEPYLLFLTKSLIAFCNCTVDKCSKSP